MKCLEEEKVNLATYVLQGQAEFWWQALQLTRFADQEGLIPQEEFLELFRAKYFPDHMQEWKEREFDELVQGSVLVADYEAKISTLGRYAPHIFDNLRRKLKKFIDGLRSNIKRYVATNDPETFTRTLTITHLAEIKNDKFITEQKSNGKRPLSVPTDRQKDKQTQKHGHFHA